MPAYFTESAEIGVMQEKSESSLEFLERTDRLASALGITVSALSEVMSLSNGMLFAYRSGKHPISRKAWLKLDVAEKKAGIGIKTPITPIQESDVSGRRVLEAAAILRRQAAELMEAANRLDPAEEAKAREYLASVHRRVAEEEAARMRGPEQKRA